MSQSAVPIFGLVRDFLLCPHKANYGKATLPPAPRSIFHKNYELIHKEGRNPAELIISSKHPSLLNPFTISTPGLSRRLTFNMNSGRDLSFSGTSS